MKTSFDNEGFLGDEANEIRSIIHDRFATTFVICKKVNQLAHRIRKSIVLDYENSLHVVLICLFQRILDSFQSVVILMSLGLESDSNSITRSSIEAMLKLRMLTEDVEYIEKYLGSDQIRRKRILNAAKNKPQSIIGLILQGPELDKVLGEVIENIKEMKLSELSVEAIARQVGLGAWYDLTYRNLSEDLHSGPRSLEKYVKLDKKNGVTLFNFNPKCDRLVPILITEAAIVLTALNSIEEVFQCGYETQIDALFESIKHFKDI